MRSCAALVVLVVACGGKTPSPATDSPDPTAGSATEPTRTCDAIQADARATLSKALEANRACGQATDCIAVGFGAGCFDSCSRVIAASGQADYDRAVIAIDGAQCHEYALQGCPTPISPPCAPPATPTCNAGVCQ